MSEQKSSNGSRGGRPSDYGEWTAGEVNEYLDLFVSGELPDSEILPTRAGLCLYLGISKKSLNNWVKAVIDSVDDNDSQFIHSVLKLDQMQEVRLVSNGLIGEYSSPIAKLMLSNHGYVEKVDNVSSDGSMTPKPFNDFYAKPSES